MEPSPSKKKDSTLTKEELDQLLAFLNPDLEKAANDYVIICKKLIVFFHSRGCRAPEYYTDVTMKRVARKLTEGVEIYAVKPSSFIYGIASKVLQECWDDISQKSISLDDPSVFVEISRDPVEEGLRDAQRLQFELEMECLEECLREIPFKDRDFILRYYQGETGVKISNRKKLAEQQGISLNALRIKAFRIRERLQDCVSRYVKRLTDA